MEYESPLKVTDPMIRNGRSKKPNVVGKMTMLTVDELPFKLKERTVAVIDPKVMKNLDLSTGDVVEIAADSDTDYHKRTKIYAVLWCGRAADYGKKIIRIDLRARMDIGVTIGDKVTIRKVKPLPKAQQVVLIHSERLVASGLEQRLLSALEGAIVTVGMVIPIEILRRTNRFLVISTRPSNMPAVTIDSKTTKISIKPVMDPRWQVSESDGLGNSHNRQK